MGSVITFNCDWLELWAIIEIHTAGAHHLLPAYDVYTSPGVVRESSELYQVRCRALQETAMLCTK